MFSNNSIIFIIVVLVTNAIQAITGFAGTLLAMPVSMMLIGVNEAKAILNIMAMLSCFWITIKSRKYINFKELGKITAFMFAGMIIGIQLFKLLPLEFLLYAYAVLIIIIALKGLLIKKKISVPSFIMIIVLLAAGIIHGMFVSGGSLLVVYAVSVLKDKNEFRATIAPVWVILNVFMMFDHINSGYFTKEVTILMLVCIIPLFLGVAIGNKMHEKINQSTFMKLTYILLLASGVLLIV